MTPKPHDPSCVMAEAWNGSMVWHHRWWSAIALSGQAPLWVWNAASMGAMMT